MRKRRMLQNPFSLAAIAVCGVMLAGCGGDGNRSNFDLDDPNVNLLPVCTVVSATVDLATQQVVVTVALRDPDQEDKFLGMEVSIDLITSSAGTFANDIDSATSGNLIIGNTVFGVQYDVIPTGIPGQGFQTTFRISSTTPQLLPSDPNSSVRVTVVDKRNGTSTCQASVDLSLLLSEPDCQILGPGAAAIGTGIIPIDLQISDNQGDSSQVNVFYSLDGGVTLNPATLTGTTLGNLGATTNCNPANPGGQGVINIPTNLGGGAVAFTVSWDSLADMVGLNAVTAVTIVIYSQDCSTAIIGGVFNAPCTQATSVLNNGAPVCAITAPAAGSMQGGTGDVAIDYTTTDMDSASVSALVEWSSNGGTTWNLATAGAASANPQSAAPGASTFNWNVPSDIAVGALPLNVNVRITVDDNTGRPTLMSCTTGIFTLVPISEPSCTWTAPAAGVCIDGFPAGTISLQFNVTDAQGEPINFSVCYNTGGGNLPATLTATSNGILAAYAPTNGAACVGASNQVTGAGNGATSVTWDIVADMQGAMMCDNVTITVYPEDGTTMGAGAFFTCSQTFQVANNGAPSCTATGLSDTQVTFDLVDADSAMVSVLFQYSVAGGPFVNKTPGVGATNPQMFAPGVGRTWPWAGTTDFPVCTANVVCRITVDDGVALPNRPATCSSAPRDVNCIPALTACRATNALGSANPGGPTGVVPMWHSVATRGAPPSTGDIANNNGNATNYWAFDYLNLNVGTFNNTVQLTDAGGNNVGNPVVLFTGGHDYSLAGPGSVACAAGTAPAIPARADGAMCNAPGTRQIVLEASAGGVVGDYASAMTAFMGTTVNTTWMSSDPSCISVSADGLLTAVGENCCATITWTNTSGNPAIITIDPSCASGTFAACVDSGGADFMSRQTNLPIGDIDGNFGGLPSGRPVPGVGGKIGITWIVNSGTSILAAYAARSEYDETIMNEDGDPVLGTDQESIGGSTQTAIGFPFAVNTMNPCQTRWNDVNTSVVAPMGIFDIASQTFDAIGSGTTTVLYVNEELADPTACNIWIANPCMPFNTTPACMPPPMGGYVTIAGSGSITVP